MSRMFFVSEEGVTLIINAPTGTLYIQMIDMSMSSMLDTLSLRHKPVSCSRSQRGDYGATGELKLWRRLLSIKLVKKTVNDIKAQV